MNSTSQPIFVYCISAKLNTNYVPVFRWKRNSIVSTWCNVGSSSFTTPFYFQSFLVVSVISSVVMVSRQTRFVGSSCQSVPSVDLRLLQRLWGSRMRRTKVSMGVWWNLTCHVGIFSNLYFTNECKFRSNFHDKDIEFYCYIVDIFIYNLEADMIGRHGDT